jgi:dienelactone hydrolase
MKKQYICLILIMLIDLSIPGISQGQNTITQEQSLTGEEYLNGTKPLSLENIEVLRSEMIGGMFSYFSKVLESGSMNKKQFWNQNYSSTLEYEESVASNRERFKEITGIVDERMLFDGLILMESTTRKALIAETDNYSVYRVKWPVLEGVTGTGLWVEPKENVQAQVVVIPDADQSPGMLMGLSPGVSDESLLAPRLANAGCRLIIPMIIDRNDTWSGNQEVAMTNQPHREFIYRRAYQMGRHIIGYEVQKVLAAVDWFKLQSAELPVGVAGYGEGGLLAFYSGAADCRIDGVLVSGYFQERDKLWEEPLYRNVWGLLEEFGDAEIAGLIAPRLLVIEACKGPEIEGPPAASGGRKEVAAPGRLITPPLKSVVAEVSEAEQIFKKLNIPSKFQLVISGNGEGLPGTMTTSEKLLIGLGVDVALSDELGVRPTALNNDFDSDACMRQQVNELLNHVELLIKDSPKQREKFWSMADPSSVEKWEESTEVYRDYFWKEVIGKMPSPDQQFNPHSKLIYETPNWKGYLVMLDVWDGIPAGGILLVPNNLKQGEQSPLVVLQHGLGGRAESYVNPERNSFGSRLAELGYIVYAPQNPYGLDNFRIFQRMANPLKQSVFSITIGQHAQTLQWLKTLPFVDGEVIGFYGLSYGGKSAVRIPAMLKDYKVVVCSGDFNEWVWKTTSMDFPASYMFVGEYEVFEFNLGNRVNYAEMAGLIAPRAFMVERGHWDPVAPDEWVAYEYAKVRRLYTQLGISERTDIEFFDGGHKINGVETLKFLDKHLKGDRK